MVAKAETMTDGGAQVDTEDHAPGAQAVTAEPRKKPVRLIAGVVLGLGALGVAGWYVAHAGLQSTDDAQVDADVVTVPARVSGSVLKVLFAENQKVAAGDVLVEIDPASFRAKLAQAEADVAAAKAAADAADAEVSVIDATARGQKSVAEASLQGANIGVTSSADEIAQADAAVAVADAARRQAESDLTRTRSLVESNALAKQQLDSAQTAFDGATANLAQAKAHQAVVRSSSAQARSRIQEARARLGQSSSVDAQIAQARARAAAAAARVATAQAERDLAALDLSYTKVVAPRAGYASKKSVAVGQMLMLGQPVTSIVPVEEVWITANFKETQLATMRPGQGVEVSVDAYPGLTLHGEVESLSAATGSRFSLLPPENATGNFTKVVQRVPIRIKLKDAPREGEHPLRPGMSADVTVDTRR
jgi:membrane fusion protein (multidrug efflux system)